MRISPTPHQLACFLAVAEHASFSDAARHLAVSQPALSRTIRLIEDALGARLFDRDTRNVALTPVGTELLPVAQRLTAEFSSAFGELGHFVAGRGGRVSVAALPSLAAVFLPRVIAGFAATHPEVQVLIDDRLSGSVLDAVLAGQADIGLTVEPARSGRLDYRPLGTDRFALVCRGDDALARRRSLPWSAFLDRRFIAMARSSSVRAMTDAALLQAGVAVPMLYECTALGTTGHLVAAGLGITALPRLTLALTAAPGLAWRPLTHPVMRRSLGVVTRTGRSLSPAARLFLDLLEREARSLADLRSPAASPAGR